MMIFGLFAVSIDQHVPHDSDFAVFVVRHRLWLVLVPLVSNVDSMILTDIPVEIRCSFIVPGDIFCFG